MKQVILALTATFSALLLSSTARADVRGELERFGKERGLGIGLLCADQKLRPETYLTCTDCVIGECAGMVPEACFLSEAGKAYFVHECVRNAKSGCQTWVEDIENSSIPWPNECLLPLPPLSGFPVDNTIDTERSRDTIEPSIPRRNREDRY